MSQQILDAIESQNSAFAEFKRANDAKLLEQRKTIEALEAKLLNRPGNGGVNIETGSGHTTRSGISYSDPETKAFVGYMRSGVESRELKAMDITNPGEGGYALPKQIASQVTSMLLKYSFMRKVVTVEQAFTQDYHHLVSDPKTTGSAWVGEMAARPATNTPALFDAAPPMGEIYANPQITQTALDDIFFNAEQFLVDNVVQVFSSAEGAAFIAGSGVNQPKGILTYPMSTADDFTRPYGTIQYIPTTSAAGFAATTAAVSPFDVLQQVYFALRAQYRVDAAWFMNSATAAFLGQVKDMQGRFVMVPAQVAGTPPTILGLPVYEDQFFPSIAANAFPIALISKRAYLIVDRMPIRSLRDPYTNRPFIGMYTTKRLGGGLLSSEAIKVAKISVA